VRIILRNSPDPLTEDDGRASGDIKYTRAMTESVAAFRDRATADAEARGCASIIFGASEEDDC
jgi:hypothetical protein